MVGPFFIFYCFFITHSLSITNKTRKILIFIIPGNFYMPEI